MEILMRGFVVAVGGYLATLMFLSEGTSKLLWILLGLGPVMLAIATGIERDARQRAGPGLPP
jgi:hypothetical protein